MKQGIKTIQNLYGELERQRAARKDLIADTRSITVNSVNGLSMLTVATDSDKLSYRISEIAHRQIADRLGIPYKYYERMRQENPALLDSNINSWLNTTPEKRMLRTLDGKLRAFLSDRYRRLDNLCCPLSQL
ncbi:pF06067 domain protein [Phascolarctobacterium sp. CAG:266]|nr:pF06067 domain protein [Phascolarctobacterium sp. CAG:266]